MRRLMGAGYSSIISILLSASVLSACAIMSEKECVNADWTTYGFLDGSQGYQKTYLNTRTKACQEHGVTVGVDAYLQGWQRGVRQYCTPDNAFSQGRRGASYQGVCPLDMEPVFIHYHQEGLIMHAAHQRLDAIEKDIHALQETLNALEQDILKTRTQLEVLDLNRAERQVLLDKLEDLHQTRTVRAVDLQALYRLQDEAKANLRVMQTQHPKPYRAGPR